MKSFISNQKKQHKSTDVEIKNKLVLKPNDENSSSIELNKIDNQIYVVNINRSCLIYNGNKQYMTGTCNLEDKRFLFRV